MRLELENEALPRQIAQLQDRIAALERLELTVSRNARMFEALLRASRDGIALTDIDGNVIRLVRGILGYSPASVQGMPVTDLVYEEDRQAILEAYAELVRGRRGQVRREVRLLRPDHSILWAEVTMTDMLDDPDIMAIIHNYRDITWRRKGDVMAGELAAALAFAPATLFSVDLTGTLRTWHAGCELLFGFSSDEITGEHVRLLIPPEGEEADRHTRTEVIGSGLMSARTRTAFRTKTGDTVHAELVVAPLVSDGAVQGTVYIVPRA